MVLNWYASDVIFISSIYLVVSSQLHSKFCDIIVFINLVKSCSNAINSSTIAIVLSSPIRDELKRSVFATV